MLSHRVTAYYGLIRASGPLPPAYLLRPAGLLRGHAPEAQRVPDLLYVSVPSCRLPYPGGLNGCTRLLLGRPPWPSPSSHWLGIRISALTGSRADRVTRLLSSLYATARRIACPSPERACTPELSPPKSPRRGVEYNYAGKQSTPAAGLSPARHAALRAANEGTKYTKGYQGKF